MAIVRMDPVSVHVRAGWLDGAPREITRGEVRFPVTRLTAVRTETSAFRAAVGPRTYFEVETPGVKLALCYTHRSHRWTVNGVDDEVCLS
jgi:hypothetical protein